MVINNISIDKQSSSSTTTTYRYPHMTSDFIEKSCDMDYQLCYLSLNIIPIVEQQQQQQQPQPPTLPSNGVEFPANRTMNQDQQLPFYIYFYSFDFVVSMVVICLFLSILHTLYTLIVYQLYPYLTQEQNYQKKKRNNKKKRKNKPDSLTSTYSFYNNEYGESCVDINKY